MTGTRDPDRLIDAFFEEGPTVLADRVVEAIRDDVDAINQRARFGPWRTIPMIRPIRATAAIIAVLAAGLAVYSIVRPDVGIEPVEPTPVPSPAAFPGVNRTALTVGSAYL